MAIIENHGSHYGKMATLNLMERILLNFSIPYKDIQLVNRLLVNFISCLLLTKFDKNSMQGSILY